MRTNSIICDWCEQDVGEEVVTYAHHILVPHATFEGERSSWDFCNNECLDAWRSHQQRPKRVDQALTAQGR